MEGGGGAGRGYIAGLLGGVRGGCGLQGGVGGRGGRSGRGVVEGGREAWGGGGVLLLVIDSSLDKSGRSAGGEVLGGVGFETGGRWAVYYIMVATGCAGRRWL